MDDIDRGQAAAEEFRQLALAQPRRSDAPAEGEGFCLWCEEETGSRTRRWCCAECRDFWSRRRDRNKREGVDE